MDFKKLLVLSILSALQITSLKAENTWPTTEIWGRPDFNKFVLKNQKTSSKPAVSPSSPITYNQPIPSLNKKIPSPSDTQIWGRPNFFNNTSSTTTPSQNAAIKLYEQDLEKRLELLANVANKNKKIITATKNLFNETKNSNDEEDLEQRFQTLKDLADESKKILPSTKQLFNETEQLFDHVQQTSATFSNVKQLHDGLALEEDLEEGLQELDNLTDENTKLLDEIKQLFNEDKDLNPIQDTDELEKDIEEGFERLGNLADENTSVIIKTKQLLNETEQLLDNSKQETESAKSEKTPQTKSKGWSFFDAISQRSTKYTLSKIFKDCAIYDQSDDIGFPGIDTILDLWNNKVNPAKRSVQVSSHKIKEMWNSLTSDNQQDLINQWINHKIRDDEIHRAFSNFRKNPK